MPTESVLSVCSATWAALPPLYGLRAVGFPAGSLSGPLATCLRLSAWPLSCPQVVYLECSALLILPPHFLHPLTELVWFLSRNVWKPPLETWVQSQSAPLCPSRPVVSNCFLLSSPVFPSTKEGTTCQYIWPFTWYMCITESHRDTKVIVCLIMIFILKPMVLLVHLSVHSPDLKPPLQKQTDLLSLLPQLKLRSWLPTLCELSGVSTGSLLSVRGTLT